MAQTPSLMISEGETIDYTPGSAVSANNIVVFGGMVCFARTAISASTLGSLDTNCIVKGPALGSETIAVGDAIYWDTTGSPSGGDASSGAFTKVATGTTYPAGIAVEASSSAATVKVKLLGHSPFISRNSNTALTAGVTLTALGTTQSSAPTAAQLLGGFLTQTGSTGAGAVTLPTGTAISAACWRTPVAGDTFECVFANLGGGQTLTITGATGSTVVSGGAIATACAATLKFICTAANTWSVAVVGK